MSKGYVDKRLGMYRDAGDGITISDPDLRDLIEQIVNNAFIGYNEDLRQYIDELYALLEQNIYNAGDEITQEMIDYFNTVVNNMRTVLETLIINNPALGDTFQTYVENLITDLETYVNNLTLGDTFTQVFKDYIDNLIQQITNIYGDPTILEELKTYIDNLFEIFEGNTFNLGDEITQEMIDYFQTILDQLTVVKEQITNLDEINSEFKTYIDNLFQDFEDYITNNLILGNTFTEVIQNYIDDSITNLETVLKQFIENYTNQYFQENVTTIIKNYYDETNATRLISGSVTWLQDLDFEVSQLVYEILGQRLESLGGLLTILPNESADPMFAVIYADVYGSIGYVLGTPAAAPAVPIVNPSTQLALTTVYIAGLGTVPTPDPGGETGDIANEVIYDENIEWQTAKVDDAAITSNLEDLTDPAQGTKHISLVTAGGDKDWEKLKTETTHKPEPPAFFNVDVAEELIPANRTTADLGISVAKIYPDHGTNVIADGIMRVTVYQYHNKNKITAVFKNTATGVTYPAIFVHSSDLQFSVTEVTGLTFLAPQNLRLTESGDNIPAGNYDISFVGFYKYVYRFALTGSAIANPTTAQISFTRAAGSIDANDGNISFSLKNSINWLATTGLLIELYNGVNKVGNLVFLAGNYGFNPVNTEYQRITIPVADFNPTNAEIDKIIVRPVNTWPAALNFYIDNIVLQTGVETENPDTPVKVGDWIEDIAFEFRDVTAAGDEYILDISATFAYNIVEAILQTDAGTITAKVSIAGTDITGLDAAAVDNTIKSFQPTALNKVATGEQVKLTISAFTDATTILGKLKIRRK